MTGNISGILCCQQHELSGFKCVTVVTTMTYYLTRSKMNIFKSSQTHLVLKFCKYVIEIRNNLKKSKISGHSWQIFMFSLNNVLTPFIYERFAENIFLNGWKLWRIRATFQKGVWVLHSQNSEFFRRLLREIWLYFSNLCGKKFFFKGKLFSSEEFFKTF